MSGAWAPLFGSMLHVDAARDRIVTSTRGDSIWVLPLGHPGDWTPLANAGPSPGGDAWLAAFDPGSDRGIAFGGTVTSNGVWQVAFDASLAAGGTTFRSRFATLR